MKKLDVEIMNTLLHRPVVTACVRAIVINMLCFTTAKAQSQVLDLGRLDAVLASSYLVHNALYKSKTIQSDADRERPMFVVQIEIKRKSTTYRCTGALITEDVVLTAGHCLVGADQVTVLAIEHFSPLQQRRIQAKKWVYHKKYNGEYNVTANHPTLDHLIPATADKFTDLGLIALPVKLKKNSPMRISSINFDPAAGDYYIFAFGLGRNDDFKANGQLHYIPIDSSTKLANSTIYVGDTPLGTGWCTGDSGGPVSVIFSPPEEPTKTYHYLIGVAFAYINLIYERDTEEMANIWGGSANVPHCGNKIYYTRISRHIPWIEAEMKAFFPGEERELSIFID